MVRPKGGIQRAFRWTAIGLTILAGSAVTIQSTSARTRLRLATPESYRPSTASIVVDVNSGAVMAESNADAPRHPASLTKIMTLYLLFEALEAGKLKMVSELSVSPYAAEQAPSKLGLMPGDTISVNAAIRAMITKSANDVAVTIAEAVGGNESHFAKMMTAKARALGMMRTNYNNASGLPDDEQITTARDQAILARAIYDRFPQFYHYFSTPSFNYRGVIMRNHNRLLGRIAGVDGMKTGYIRASGYNIITSVQRGKRRIVTVVFGGHTARERDKRAINLIENNINIASLTRTAPRVVEGWMMRPTTVARTTKPATVARIPAPALVPTPSADPRSQTLLTTARPAEELIGSTEPIKPKPVKTVIVQSEPAHEKAPGSLPLEAQLSPSESTALASATSETPASELINSSSTSVAVKEASAPGSNGTVTAASPVPASPLPAHSPAPSEPQPKILDGRVTQTISAIDDGVATPQTDKPKAHNILAKTNDGWIIQIGAFDDEKEAKERLQSAQNKAKNFLDKADPFTEKVDKGERAFYRARFAGLGKEQAETACKHLKRSDIPCMMLRN